jgi:hypothetical protein
MPFTHGKASLARPGGNATGLSNFTSELVPAPFQGAKLLDLPLHDHVIVCTGIER